MLALVALLAAQSFALTVIQTSVSTTAAIQIYACSFANFANSSGGGSAIYQSSYSPCIIRHCMFSDCTGYSYGGCIYSNSSTCNISTCCFTKCYITQAINDLFGNAMFLYSSSIAVSKCSAYRCGPSTTAGDSTFYCNSMNTLCSFGNFTSCDGYGGAAGIDIDRSSTYSSSSFSIEYIHISSSVNFHAFVHQATSDSSTTAYIDIINCTFNNNMFWYNTGSSIIEYCYIFATSYAGFYGPGTISFVQCYADFTTYGFTKTGSTATIDIGSLAAMSCLDSDVYTSQVPSKMKLFLFSSIIQIVSA